MDLALHWDEGPVLLRDVARRQEISLSYLEHLITPLVAGGIVKSIRGPRGGVSLLEHPQKIKLSEVIQLLEGSIAPVECIDNREAYPRSDFCATREIWDEVKKAIDGVLESTTLLDLLERQKRKWNLNQLKEHEKQCSNGDDAKLMDDVRNERGNRREGKIKED